MAKEYYQVTYKTYFNERVKPILFQGKETFPLYIQITYDRKTNTLKSYYFDTFAQPKYDYLQTTIEQMDVLESRVIDYVTDRYSDRFELYSFPGWYQMFNKDVLDGLEEPFKKWLITFFQEEQLPGYAVLIEKAMNAISGIQLLDEFKTGLPPSLYERLQEQAARQAPPYIPLAAYVRHTQPNGPFCLPLHEWLQHEKTIDAEEYIYKEFYAYDMGKIMRTIRHLLHPKGFP